MMRNIRQLIATACLGCCTLNAFAHDFTVAIQGQKMYFNITSVHTPSVEITYKGGIAENHISEVQGMLAIPTQVKHNNVVYNVTGIGAKAFSGATHLTGIVLPSSVKTIGDFAFEGCINLSKVVFPGNAVNLGQGTFFKCIALKDLSFGSDWKTLDLTPYRWSDSLQVISVPAKVEKIQNLKSIPSLRTVEVDANNARFSGDKGVLYSKDGKTLYGVPRAYTGPLKIKQGTENITKGALMDCLWITWIDIPATVQNMSFRETSRMPGLTEVVLRAESPMTTAYANGQSYFLLQVANPAVKITVSKNAKNTYERQWITTPGEYTESAQAGSIPYAVTIATLPQVKNLNGIKNFDKYE